MTRSHRETAWSSPADEQRSFLMGNRTPALAQRSGLTLVELLVVIVIIAVLAALITPAIFQARISAKNAVIKAEIDMLHMAIVNYKNEYGSFPPCTSASGPDTAAAQHIRSIFPRTPTTYAGNAITPGDALTSWLAGYSKNPKDPLSGTRVKRFEFDQTRVTSSGQFYPTDKPGSPYIYIDSGSYGSGFPVGEYTYTADQNDNPNTFQILCAGLDEEWDTEDDLSNFWKGTRGDQ